MAEIEVFRMGRKKWAVAGGHIPLRSTGKEPKFVSSDKISILNSDSSEANIKIIIFYPDNKPVGIYEFKVKPQRVRKVRFNDLINPSAMPLDVDFAALIESDVPVVVQFTRMDTSHKNKAIMGTMAYPAE